MSAWAWGGLLLLAGVLGLLWACLIVGADIEDAITRASDESWRQ